MKHDFSNEAISAFKASISSCRTQIKDMRLSSEQLSFPLKNGIIYSILNGMEVDVVNKLPDLLGATFTQCEIMLDAVHTKIEWHDTDNAALFSDIISDIGFLVSSFNAVSKTLGMSDLETEGSFENLNSTVSSLIYSLKVSDYFTLNEDGNYEYKYDNIKDLFSKGKNLSSVDYSILVNVLQTCIETGDLNTEELERLINCSCPSDMADADADKNAGRTWAIIYSALNQKSDLLIDNYAYYLIMDDATILTLPKEEQDKIKRIKNTIALKDIAGATEKYFYDCSSKNSKISKLKKELGELYLVEGQAVPLFSGDSRRIEQEVKDAQVRIREVNSEIEKLEKQIGFVKISKHRNQNGHGYYWNITGDETLFATITEYNAGNRQCSLLEDLSVNLTFDTVISDIEAYKKDDSQTLEEYLDENYDEMEATMKVVKKIPIAGDVVGLGYDAGKAVGYGIKGKIDGQDYSYEIFDSSYDAFGDLVGVIGTFGGGGDLDLGDIDKSTVKKFKNAKKYSAPFVQTAKEVYSKEDAIDNYYDQQREILAWNKEIDAIVEKVKNGSDAYNALSRLEALYENSTSVFNGASCSMTFYYDSGDFEQLSIIYK